MKLKLLRKTSIICSILLTISSFMPVYSESTGIAPYALPENTSSNDKTNSTDNLLHNNEMISEITLDVNSAVDFGIEHNTVLKSLEKKIALATITFVITNENETKIQDANSLLKDSELLLSQGTTTLNNSQSELNQAQALLDLGLTPSPLPLIDNLGNPIKDINGDPIILNPGDAIKTALETLPNPAFDSATVNALYSAIIATIQSSLDSKQAQINSGITVLASSKEAFVVKEKEFQTVLAEVSDSLGMKLQSTSNTDFTADEASILMNTMASVNLNVSNYALRIYKNQIAMLIQKDFYDTLLSKQTLLLKEKAEERGRKQYEIVDLSYQNGMKSKQDLLFSKMYFNSSQIATRIARSEYNKQLNKLKKDISINNDCIVTLVDNSLETINTSNLISLDDALKSGMVNRLEIQKCIGQRQIMKINYELLDKRTSTIRDNNAISEAKIQLEQAELDLQVAKENVTSEIYQSYENVMAMKDSLLYSESLVDDAKEVVEIAKLKYEQGFGADNALLQSLNLESSSGTIVELIATEEKLSEVEEKVATIRYNYIMARIKYYNDAALLNVLEN